METVTFEKLPEMVALLLKKVQAIEELLNEKQLQNQEDELLSIQEASAFLNLSVATLYSKVCRQEVPVSKPGNRLYFNKTELTNWVKSARKPTRNEIENEADLILKRNGSANRQGLRYRTRHS